MHYQRQAHRGSSNATMQTQYAKITIQNLRLRTYIGFNEEELEKQQDIVINIEIQYRLDPQVLQDKVESALNYKIITKKVIALVENGRFLLLEKLVADILEVCSEHPSVNTAQVTVDKPHALRFADSVSLTLEYEAEYQVKPNFLEKAS